MSDRDYQGATFAVTVSAPALSPGFQLSLGQRQPAVYSSQESRQEISNCGDVVAYVELNSDECFLSGVDCKIRSWQVRNQLEASGCQKAFVMGRVLVDMLH